MAGFNTAVTGLKASSTDLDVIGNNIANSSTIGFKSSRTEFADLYATAVVGAGASNTPGSGVTVADIAQDFSAGTIQFTNNNLDLAINGSGFFQLDDGQGGISYTRAGNFELDKNGFITTKNGNFLQGYGLDENSNLTPIGPLAVTEKESPPKATSDIDFSFNINSALDPSDLNTPYNREQPTTFSFSSTLRTYDSLGNENTIKMNFVEQQPRNEIHTYTVSDFDPDANAGTINSQFLLSGIQITLPDAATAASNFVADPTASPLTQITDNTQSGWLSDDMPAGTSVLTDLQTQDPRIDRVFYNGATQQIQIYLKSDSSESGPVLVNADPTTNPTTDVALEGPVISYNPSNEVHNYGFATGTGEALENGYAGVIEFNFGGVDFRFDGTAPADPIQASDIADAIVARQATIIENNPDVEEVTFTGGQLQVTYRAEVDSVASAAMQLDVTTPDPGVTAIFTGAQNTAGITLPDTEYPGDPSFKGVYRMYAYLNNDVALDIGKVVPPGDSGFLNGETEVGAVTVRFDPSTGQLAAINGNSVSNNGTADPLTIRGADTANPNSDESNISLDLTGSTQFSSDSIVKRSSQDGYPKGDLIGVTFEESGEMVASFSNGEKTELGVVAIATFENQSGLRPAGSTEWIASLDSGDPILNPPGTGLNGTLRSAALEQSNVDLSAELVKLIEAQRNFQANSKTLETLNTVTQNILQI